MADKTQFNAEEYIKNMYDSSIASQKEQLTQNYEQNVSDLDAQKEAARKQTDENLTRTYVEAAKAQKNYDEVQNAYGLTSGAMAQARLAQDNQLQADLTAIRAAQQSVDADVERQRGLLSKEYQAAIAEAQANNDLARAEALFEQAKAEDERLKEQQLAAANLMAGAGDYSLIGQLYGLTPEQLAKLQGQSGGYYGDTGDDDENGNVDLSGLFAATGGKVTNKAVWDSYVALYGADALAAAGITYEEEPSEGGGKATGGRGGSAGDPYHYVY